MALKKNTWQSVVNMVMNSPIVYKESLSTPSPLETSQELEKFTIFSLRYFVSSEGAYQHRMFHTCCHSHDTSLAFLQSLDLVKPVC